MRSLYCQHFAAPCPPSLENSLPTTGGHPRPKTVHARPMAALGLIGSLGHFFKNLYSDILVEQKLYLYA